MNRLLVAGACEIHFQNDGGLVEGLKEGRTGEALQHIFPI